MRHFTLLLLAPYFFDEGKREVSMNYARVCACAPSFERYADRVHKLAHETNRHLAARKGNP